MAEVTEIGPDLYRICVYLPDFDLQFNHFLVDDEEPLLFHAGYNAWFPEVQECLATVIDPARLRWIGFSHFESDECGALNQWLEVAQSAEPVCSQVGAAVSVNDFAIRPPRGMEDGEVLTTGKHRFGWFEHRTFLMGGMLRSCSKRRPGLCFVRTCSIRWERLNP